MLSPDFEQFIKSELEELERKEQAKRAQRESAARTHADNVEWFEEHVAAVLEETIDLIQQRDPASKLLKLELKANTDDLSARVIVTNTRGPNTSRELVFSLTERSVKAEAIKPRSNASLGSKPFESRIEGRVGFTGNWVVKTVEAFVCHSVQNPV
jgi:transcription elongation GreA/GreB family factor